LGTKRKKAFKYSGLFWNGDLHHDWSSEKYLRSYPSKTSLAIPKLTVSPTPLVK
jgi:hypothetical protein